MIQPSRLSVKEQEIYRHAEEMLARGTDAATFSARFFGPEGEMSGLGRDREERRKILGSELYRWLKAEYARLRQADFEQSRRTSRLDRSAWL
jgi:hypothetical protein